VLAHVRAGERSPRCIASGRAECLRAQAGWLVHVPL